MLQSNHINNMSLVKTNGHQNSSDKSTDEVDCVKPSYMKPMLAKKPPLPNLKKVEPNNNHSQCEKTKQKSYQLLTDKKLLNQRNRGSIYGDCDVIKSCSRSSSVIEKLHKLHFPIRKKSVPSIDTVPKERPKYVKSASIARLFGNSYNPQKMDNTSTANANKSGDGNSERFQKCVQFENNNGQTELKDFTEDNDLSTKALRTLSRGLGKLFWKKSHSIDISQPDPEYKVSYLGNVLTGWAKGDGCVEKPLNTLWRNYTQSQKPEVVMRIRVCPSGLKATTRQHGLTEYWSHRITYCCSPKNYPKIFCWVYRHEGRKLKHELRCHAVLCAKESIADDMAAMLRENLARALMEFKRDKINRQNARLSLANSAYENPSMPQRKILLSVGGNNYRPPLERSKSAPKLMVIEEAIGEEDEEEEEKETSTKQSEIDRRSCCKIDPLYPAMTLGRRRCRRGHSIRRTGNRAALRRRFDMAETMKPADHKKTNEELEIEKANKRLTGSIYVNDNEVHSVILNKESYDRAIDCDGFTSHPNVDQQEPKDSIKTNTKGENFRSNSCSEIDDDDYNSLLHDDSESPMVNELLSYFDMTLSRPRPPPSTVSLSNLLDTEQEFKSLPSLNKNALSMDDLDQFTDSEHETDEHILGDEACNHVFFDQDEILDILISSSQKANYKLSTIKRRNGIDLDEENGSEKQENSMNSEMASLTTTNSTVTDSDEGSISSGCETSSTVTSTQEEGKQLLPSPGGKSDDTNTKQSSQHSDAILKQDHSIQKVRTSKASPLRSRFGATKSIHRGDAQDDISDSEFSDESGYVEFQEYIAMRSKLNS